MNAPYTLDPQEVLRQLGVDAGVGLSDAEGERRRAEFGSNEIVERAGRSAWRMLLDQFIEPMVLVLIAAAIISGVIGDLKDTVAIVVIVLINAALGFNQEFRAERAMAALKRLAAPRVHVRRNGTVEERPARDLVPGDIVLLDAGAFVPADARLIEVANLRTQESALTGESLPVEKSLPPLAHDVPLAERLPMVYMGTAVTYGRAVAVVTATGMRTELGRIASMLQEVTPEPTPLQRRLAQLSKLLIVAAVAIILVIVAEGLLTGEPIETMFLTAVSMAVAAVPEGLPAVVTIALAIGAQRMLRRRALIRKLAAVESLGSVTVICSDKTGTLTENRMTVTMLDVAGDTVNVSERMREATPVFDERTAERLAGEEPAMLLLLAGAALCNDAVLKLDEEENGIIPTVGDPTEGALLVAAAKHGFAKQELDAALPRVAEAPFESERKRMTTVHAVGSANGGAAGSVARAVRVLGDARFAAFTKGSVDGLLEVSTACIDGRAVVPLIAPLRERIIEANARLAGGGMRVLGVAARLFDHAPAAHEELERDLVFIGLAAMIDPARPEAKAAVRTCVDAGIRPVMITGDHPLTARAIAAELGFVHDGEIVTGSQLERMDDEELHRVCATAGVYARVSPEHKLRIVRALQDRGEIVAMTGDGVNDAPALKRADIGVAMGIAGTDVSKEAADMVLLDDNFATIVAAVEEGRIIYDNIRKFIKYLLTSNSGELWLMFLAPLLGMPVPLLPIQILWINLVTDGLPALALGFEPAERNVMHRPPFRPNENIFGRGMGRHILLMGFVMGIVPLATGWIYWRGGLEHWRTVLFCIITLAQLGHALAVRSGIDSLFTIGMRSNMRMVFAVSITFVLQLVVIYTPALQPFFATQSLTFGELVLMLLLSSTVFWAVEFEKLLQRRMG